MQNCTMTTRGFTWFGAVALAGLTGCFGAETRDEATNSVAPAAESETLDDLQLVTSVNADGTWTGNAATPVVSAGTSNSNDRVQGSATFTGPTGATRKLGVCLLQFAGGLCNSVSDCSNSPAVLPTGGARYCTGQNGGAQKHCYFRPGSQSAYCAGSPALGGAAVAPGTYTTPQIVVANTSSGSVWLSYGCFEGCATTDPSSSSWGNAQYGVSASRPSYSDTYPTANWITPYSRPSNTDTIQIKRVGSSTWAHFAYAQGGATSGGLTAGFYPGVGCPYWGSPATWEVRYMKGGSIEVARNTGYCY